MQIKIISIVLLCILLSGCAERTPMVPTRNRTSSFVVKSISEYYSMDRYYSLADGGTADFLSFISNTTSIVLPRGSFKIGDTISVESIGRIKYENKN